MAAFGIIHSPVRMGQTAGHQSPFFREAQQEVNFREGNCAKAKK